MDISDITRRPDRYHDRKVHVRGIVVSVCRQEGCFVDIVPLSGQGEGVLVSGRHGPGGYSRDVVGRIAEVKGTFYAKVYPFSRMHHWQHHSWRAGEARLPAFARIYRIGADSVTFSRTRSSARIRETPLRAHRSPVIPLDRMEFEAARMGTGKKCLAPGTSTPEHSTRRYHELLFALTGRLTIRMQGLTNALKLSPGQACYIPPHTRHKVENRSGTASCYIFVYSLPEKEKPHPSKPRPRSTHSH
ncbi:MAG: cupin domain-containing protein [bacterium]